MRKTYNIKRIANLLICYIISSLVIFQVLKSRSLNVLIFTPFIMCLLLSILHNIRYYHWIISLSALFIVVNTFDLRPTHRLEGVVLYYQFAIILISESVGCVFSEIIKTVCRKKAKKGMVKERK